MSELKSQPPHRQCAATATQRSVTGSNAQAWGIARLEQSSDDAVRMIRPAIEPHIEDLVAHDEPVSPEDVDPLPVAQSLVLDVDGWVALLD